MFGESFGAYLPALPVTCMLIVFAMNHTINGWRADRKARTDAARLRMAMRAELEVLRDSIEGNLQLIAAGKDFLLSVRSGMVVYKANISRLSVLSEAEIESLVTAYAVAEAAEAFVSATAKAHGGQSHRIIPNETPLDEVATRLRAADARINNALLVLDRSQRPQRRTRPPQGTAATAVASATSAGWFSVELEVGAAGD